LVPLEKKYKKTKRNRILEGKTELNFFEPNRTVPVQFQNCWNGSIFFLFGSVQLSISGRFFGFFPSLIGPSVGLGCVLSNVLEALLILSLDISFLFGGYRKEKKEKTKA
jgi:hypothetical protein